MIFAPKYYWTPIPNPEIVENGCIFEAKCMENLRRLLDLYGCSMHLVSNVGVIFIPLEINLKT